jgi:SAM-dependent methyltransferase
MAPTQAARKLRGAWYTQPELLDIVVSNVLSDLTDLTPAGGAPLRVLDPACGDGRFLLELRRRLGQSGIATELTGCDVDRTVLQTIDDPSVRTIHADALTHDWGAQRFDIVVGNPPFLSQMAAATSRRGSSRHGGGPYADAAAEFLALAIRLARPDGGRVGLVLPQSIIGARDAGPVRAQVGDDADLVWSWWAPRQQHFDAAVNVCALGFRRPSTATTHPASWTGVVTDRLGIPSIDVGRLAVDGTLGDRADINANFRDEYYALVPAVSDAADGPPLVTSGLIDPGVCWWGERTVTFARTTFAAPRVDLDKLTGRFPKWAARKLVPKVLVANQTRVLEAVPDPTGAWLPGVPVNTVTPLAAASVLDIAAMLTSPVATIVAWQLAAGTGLSTTTIRVGPALLGAVPWPAGDLTRAVEALGGGDVVGCGRAIAAAYGLDAADAEPAIAWWSAQLPARV